MDFGWLSVNGGMVWTPVPRSANGASELRKSISSNKALSSWHAGHGDRIGEFDLVAVDQRTVVFVEVKTRSSHDAGHPVEAMNEEKQKRLHPRRPGVPQTPRSARTSCRGST